MKRKTGRIHKIWVYLRLSYASGRDILYGISSYARAHAHWNIRLLPFPDEEARRPFPMPDEADGIISSEPLADAAARSAIPLVVIGAREKWLGRRMRSLAFVRNDDTDIGRFGAKSLRSLGKFRSFGFVPTNTPYYCSILRSEGFLAELKREGAADVRLYVARGKEDGSVDDIASLGKWLASLPKPAAIMAVHDLRATHVLEAATMMKIKVPEQMAVIGVDNDELLCDFTSPQLTSIHPDHVKEGELAAATLHAMFKRKISLRTKTFRSNAKSIVERESTRHISPGTHLAEEAMSFIRRNALKGISSTNVARHLRVSRRLCDLRFKECYGETILEAILRIRFSELKRRLGSSNTPIGKIIAACGFTCESHAKRMFRKRFGMSMREWRTRSRAQ
ncbi:MAG: substrate-binding domain-containing protein [Kiritimatiellae bacterium]|nr:substrate-binding domain-containing protein [Kiritimatiellia bacterium]